ncbi:glycosyltransferase family 2 protein [Pedobacter mucosus]|uniref:glycosyltransferase family 2 protein n=1 Tax=Pedobacter mucosus TaxID=2895286 RepID=UPI001EE3DA3C|nr:glycosyltransferase family 2 protein [Pedobacter mucosus]UKT63272.1 glycosyltransferase [Pedobacter mucosus]
MEKGLVSIITPMYNGERFVGITIDSVLSQTYSNWEMIVIDDGSSDNGPKIVAEYALKDARIKLISQANAGSAAARNNGIRMAKGQYISLLDADDTWDPIFLDSQLKFMAEKKADLVYSSHRRINEESKEILSPFMVPQQVTYEDMLHTSSISCLTGLYNIEKFGKVYLREELKSYRDDYIYWLEILKKVGIAYGNREVIANYRVMKSSTTGKKRKVVIPHFMVLYKHEKLSFFRSLYYTMSWAVIGYFKYRK